VDLGRRRRAGAFGDARHQGPAAGGPALSGAPAGATARILAALAGLPPHAAVGVAATLLVGVLQALVALWLARAVTYRTPN